MEYIAINQNSYFEHHGILGQKWGKKNGPPYPLDYAKLSPEERQKDKERAINEGDIVTANANRKYYSNQEINDVINRYTLEQKLSSLQADKIAAGLKKVDRIANVLGTVSNCVSKGADVANAFNKLSKALGSDSQNGGNNKNKKEDKDDIRDYAGISEKKLKKMAKHPGRYSKEELRTYNQWRSEADKFVGYSKKSVGKKDKEKENKNK